MGATFVLGLPLLAALIASSLRRWPKAVFVTGLVTALLIWFWLLISSPEAGSPGSIGPAAEATLVFGSSLEMAPGVRLLFLWLYPALALVFLLAWLREETIALVPSSLATMSFLMTALFIRPSSLGTLLLVGLSVVLLPAIARHTHAVTAGLRFLLFTVLALPPLLLVHWMVGSGQGAQTSALFGFLLSSLLLLGGFPFMVWVTAVTRHALLSALPLILAIVQSGVVMFLFTLLNDAPALGRGGPFRELIQWSAAATTLLAALLLHRATEWRQIIGRLLLLDMGILLLTLISPNANAAQVALWLLAGRFVSLMMACIGLTLWQRQSSFTGPVPEPGSGRRAPWSAGLLVYGCLSLLGLPLTPGFSGRWLVLTQTTTTPWVTVVVFLALAIATIALLRVVWLTTTLDQTATPSTSIGEQPGTRWLAGAAIGLALLITFFPHFLGQYFNQIAAGFQ
jgi:NADH:ubiquinone oxidoreductase subunit 2 (subunit N)